MSGVNIDDLPGASTPSGDELVEILQSDTNCKVSLTTVFGAMSGAMTIDYQEWDTPGTYTGSNGWVKPPGALMVFVRVISGGGGGGGGARGNEDENRGGGCGGAPGAVSERVYSATELNNQERVTVGSGGVGGPGRSDSSGTGGNGGITDTASAFRHTDQPSRLLASLSPTNLIQPGGRTDGTFAGAVSSDITSLAFAGITGGTMLRAIAGAGNPNGNGISSSVAHYNSASYTVGGGGGGGNNANVTTARSGGAGGAPGGSSGGGSPGSGGSATAGSDATRPGGGGGGGACPGSSGQAGTAGGKGAAPGGGGGGGGAGTGADGGNGGDGAPGIVQVYTLCWN